MLTTGAAASFAGSGSAVPLDGLMLSQVPPTGSVTDVVDDQAPAVPVMTNFCRATYDIGLPNSLGLTITLKLVATPGVTAVVEGSVHVSQVKSLQPLTERFPVLPLVTLTALLCWPQFNADLNVTVVGLMVSPDKTPPFTVRVTLTVACCAPF